MGVVIFTNKPESYRVGNFIESSGDLLYPPTGEGITYIVYGMKMGVKDAVWWASRIPYRLVVCPLRKPKLGNNETNVILDWDEKRDSWEIACKSIIQWGDRRRVAKAIKNAPIPLLLSWLKANNKDIEVWRLLAKSSFTLPQIYQEAIIAYGVKSKRGRIQYPKRKGSEKTWIPNCRESDIYAETIIGLSDNVANELRDIDSNAIPKGVKKRKQKTTRWI